MRFFTSFSPKLAMLVSAGLGVMMLAVLAAAVTGKLPPRQPQTPSEPVAQQPETAPETYQVEVPSDWQEISPEGAENRFSLRIPQDAQVSLAESNHWDVADADGKKVLTLWWAGDLAALASAMKSAAAVAPADSGPWLVQKEDSSWVVAQRLDDQKSPVEWIDAVLVSIKTL